VYFIIYLGSYFTFEVCGKYKENKEIKGSSKRKGKGNI
jgi:hypothetical protein